MTLTRSDDTFIELNERAEIANRIKATLFVSIHADSARNASANGSTVYVAPSGSGNSRALGQAIERHMKTLGLVSRGIRKKKLRVLVRTTCPAVLVELGYLSNRSEAAKLLQTNYRRSLAEAICEGILEYLRQG